MSHLWAIGYDDMERAAQVREEIARLGARHCLDLLDTAIAVRYPDGSVTLDDEPFVTASIRRNSIAGFLAGLALGAPPLSGAAVGTFLRATGNAASAGREDEIDQTFVTEVARLMNPGTSALFVLDREADMEAVLQGIRGLGGTVLKATVDLDRAKLIQSTLAADTDRA
jgi:uncharacterized membrane protein